MRFEVAGDVRARGMQLLLRPVGGGRDTPVRPPLVAGAGWTAVSVRCPDGPFTVVAIDESPTAWFAFRQPAEIGWASSTAESMIQQSWAFGAAAILMAFLAVAAPDRRRRMPGTDACPHASERRRGRGVRDLRRSRDSASLREVRVRDRRCIRCGLVYANPRAPEEKILARYSRDYFWNEYLPSLGAAEGRTIWRSSTCGMPHSSG